MLRTPVGRSRGWVRQALNSKKLAYCLTVLLRQARYVQAFWKARALVRCPEWSGPAGLLVPLLESLDKFDFVVAVEKDDLNHRGVWPILDKEPPHDDTAAAASFARSPVSSSSSSSAGGWVPPRDKWKAQQESSASESGRRGGGSKMDGAAAGGGGRRPQWMAALEGKLFGDEERAAEWKAKARTNLDWGLNALGTKFDQVATAAGKTMEEFAEEGGGASSRGAAGKKGAAKQRGSSSSSGATKNNNNNRSRRNVVVFRPAPPRGLWGVPLARLAKLESHSSLAFLSPPAALPDAFAAMLDALEESILTPGLFRRPVSGAALEAVRTYFDKNPKVRKKK